MSSSKAAEGVVALVDDKQSLALAKYVSNNLKNPRTNRPISVGNDSLEYLKRVVNSSGFHNVPGVKPFHIEQQMMTRVGYMHRIIVEYLEREKTLDFVTHKLPVYGKVFDIDGKRVASFRSRSAPDQKFEMILPPMRLSYADDNLFLGNVVPKNQENRKKFQRTETDPEREKKLTFDQASGKFCLTFSTHDADGNPIACNMMARDAMMGEFTELMQRAMFELYESNPGYYAYMKTIRDNLLKGMVQRAIMKAREAADPDCHEMNREPRDIDKVAKAEITAAVHRDFESDPSSARRALFNKFVEVTFTDEVLQNGLWRPSKKDIDKPDAAQNLRLSWPIYATMDMICKSPEDRKKLETLNETHDWPKCEAYAERRAKHGLLFGPPGEPERPFSFDDQESWSPYEQLVNVLHAPRDWVFINPQNIYGNSHEVLLNQLNLAFKPGDILMARVSIGEKKGTAAQEGQVLGVKLNVVSIQRLVEGESRLSEDQKEEDRMKDMLDLTDPQNVEDTEALALYVATANRERSNMDNHNNATFVAGLASYAEKYDFSAVEMRSVMGCKKAAAYTLDTVPDFFGGAKSMVSKGFREYNEEMARLLAKPVVLAIEPPSSTATQSSSSSSSSNLEPSETARDTTMTVSEVEDSDASPSTTTNGHVEEPLDEEQHAPSTKQKTKKNKRTAAAMEEEEGGGGAEEKQEEAEDEPVVPEPLHKKRRRKIEEEDVQSQQMDVEDQESADAGEEEPTKTKRKKDKEKQRRVQKAMDEDE